MKKFCRLATPHDTSVAKAVMSVADDAVEKHKAPPSSTDSEVETALEAGVPIYCPKQSDDVKKFLYKGIFPQHREEKQKYIDQQKTDPDNLDFNTARHQVPGLSQDVELSNVEQTSVAGKDLVRIKAWVGNTSDHDPARPAEDLKITASVGDPRQEAEPIKKSELPKDKTEKWHDTIEEFHTLPETESREGVQNFVIPDDVDKNDLWVRVTIRFKPASDKLVFEGPVNEPSIPISKR